MCIHQHLERNPSESQTSDKRSLSRLSAEEAWNVNIRQFIGFFSLALIACFFAPWVQIFLGTPSGYQIQQLPSDEAKLVWVIPITALIALVSAISNKSVALAAQTAGAMPFLAAIYYRYKLGEGFFQALQIGAYLSLALGAILLLMPHFLRKQQS